MTHVRDDAAKRAGDARIARHQSARQPDLLDQGAGMQRSPAAERHGGKPVRVVAAFDGYQADRPCHPGVGDPDDGFRRVHYVQAERIGDVPADRVFGFLDVEAVQLAADRAVRIDPSHHQVGVGHGRPVVAKAIADRPRIGTGAFRPDLQQTAPVDPGDRAATRPNGGNLDHRGADDHAEIDAGLGRKRAFAIRDQRHIEAGSAHVAGDDVRKARTVGDVSRGNNPCGGP